MQTLIYGLRQDLRDPGVELSHLGCLENHELSANRHDVNRARHWVVALVKAAWQQANICSSHYQLSWPLIWAF